MYKLLLIACLTLVFALPSATPGVLLAHDNQTAEVTDNDSSTSEEIEEIDTVEEVETVENVSTVEQNSLFQKIGKFHPLVLHFPIAWMILLVLTELAIMTGIAPDLNRWSLALLLLTLVSFIPAIVSGLGLATMHATAPDEFIDKMTLHRNYNIASGVVLLVAGIVRMAVGRNAGNRAKIGYYILVFAAAGLMIFGSHLGGEMVWGEGFLPELF